MRAGSAAGGVSHEMYANVQNQLRESLTSMEGLEKERDFYFAKVITNVCFPRLISTDILRSCEILKSWCRAS